MRLSFDRFSAGNLFLRNAVFLVYEPGLIFVKLNNIILIFVDDLLPSCQVWNEIQFNINYTF